MTNLIHDIRQVKLGRKDYYIIVGWVCAAVSLCTLVNDLIQIDSLRPDRSTTSFSIVILAVASTGTIVSFLGYVYRTLAGKRGPLTTLSLVCVIVNMVLLLARCLVDIVFSPYAPQRYDETPQYDNIFYNATPPQRLER